MRLTRSTSETACRETLAQFAITFAGMCNDVSTRVWGEVQALIIFDLESCFKHEPISTGRTDADNRHQAGGDERSNRRKSRGKEHGGGL
jgi:hypothetical protein